MRRTGLAPGTENKRNLDQVRVAIESVRGAIPVLEQSVPQQVGPIRDALSQLQMAFVRLGGPSTRPPGPAEAAPPPSPPPGKPGGREAGAPRATGPEGEQP